MPFLFCSPGIKCLHLLPSLQILDTGKFVTECSYHHSRSDDGEGERENAANFLYGELFLCLIAVLLILLSAGFSVYSLLHPRYTYKRITGAIHLFVAAVLIVLMEMVKSEAHLSTHDLVASGGAHVLAKSQVWYGYSYLLSWVVCIIFFVAGFAFFANSRKRKMLPFDLDTNFK